MRQLKKCRFSSRYEGYSFCSGKREDETVKNKIIDLGEDEGKMNADKAEGENKRNQKNHGE